MKIVIPTLSSYNTTTKFCYCMRGHAPVPAEVMT